MAAATVDLPDASEVRAALSDLHQARKQRRLADWNVIDALYKAYVGALVAGGAAVALSGAVGDARVTGAALADVTRRGPAAAGVAVALAIAMGLRAGARGGPLALEAAEVRHVLLAPIDRALALRGPAIRQLRFGAFAGGASGAVVGLVAFRRLPGNPGEWVTMLAACGALVGLAGMGAAMIGSGRRLGRGVALLIGAVVVAWSVADVATGRITSPASGLGAWMLAPLRFRAIGSLGVVVAVALAAIGFRSIGGVSLEAAERRGRLVSHLRFAATLQDIRTVMLLRRQLAQEVPRSRPWVRVKPKAAARFPIWRRDWQGIFRWPAVRVLRLAVLGVVCGLAMVGAFAGTAPLLVVAGLALFIAGLDSIEGLSQDVDHPDRRDSFPMSESRLDLLHLAAPIVVMFAVNLVAVATAAAFDPKLALSIGLPLALPAAVTAVGGSVVNTLRQPPRPEILMMDSTGLMQLQRVAWPPGLSTTGPLLAWTVHRAALHGTPVQTGVTNAALGTMAIGFLVLGWVRQRQAIATGIAGGGLSAAGK